MQAQRLAILCLICLLSGLAAGAAPKDDWPSVAGQPATSTPRPAPVASHRPLVNDPVLEVAIEDLLGRDLERYGVVVKELRRGTGVAINPDQVFYAASLFKLPIMVEAFRQREIGRLSFDDEILVREDDLEWDLGTFRMWAGDWVPIRKLLSWMITISDNTSAIMLLRRLGGRNVDAGLVALGLTGTSANDEELPTTAGDMAMLLEAIATGRAVSPAASEEMLELMFEQRLRSRIPAGLPDDIWVANKTGDWDGATHDVAIVYTPTVSYVLVVLSSTGRAHTMIAELSQLVYEYYEGKTLTDAPLLHPSPPRERGGGESPSPRLRGD